MGRPAGDGLRTSRCLCLVYGRTFEISMNLRAEPAYAYPTRWSASRIFLAEKSSMTSRSLGTALPFLLPEALLL